MANLRAGSITTTATAAWYSLLSEQLPPLAIHPFPPGCQPDSQAFFQSPIAIC